MFWGLQLLRLSQLRAAFRVEDLTEADRLTLVGWFPEFGARFGLTPRESQVLAAHLIGYLPKAAASVVGVSDSSLRTYWDRICRRTGVCSRGELLVSMLWWLVARSGRHLEAD